MMQKVQLLKVEAETKEKTAKKKIVKEEFKQLVEQRELEISDNCKLVFSIARMGEDGTPHLDIRTHISGDAYTGPTKKGINFDTELLLDFQEIIDNLVNECEEKSL